MANSLKKAFLRHEKWLVQNEGIDVDVVRQAQTVREFDKLVTTKIFGYNTVNGMFEISIF